MARFAGGGGRRGKNRGGRGFRGRGRGRGNMAANGPASKLNAKAAGGDWSNVFNPEIFQAMKNAEEAGMLHGVKTEDENKEDSDSDEDRKGIGFASQKTQKPKSLAEEKQVKEATLANIMKMVEDEKVAEELKKAREEVEDTRYLTNKLKYKEHQATRSCTIPPSEMEARERQIDHSLALFLVLSGTFYGSLALSKEGILF